MKKFFLLSLYVCLLAGLVACGEDDEKPLPTGTRTVLMYLVANNDISEDIYKNIASVEEGLKRTVTPGTFVIYWDGGPYHSDEFPKPTLFKYEVYGKGKVSKRTVIQTYEEQNSVNPDVMLKVINDMKNLCPADRYGLIFGSHATGWLPVNHQKSRSLGDDNGYKINIPELAKVLLQTNIHFDYLLMDACLMSQVEVAYELKNTAEYLILSPAEVISDGFPYKYLVEDLLATNNKEENVIQVAQKYIDFYRNEADFGWATIAVLKTSEMAQLALITKSLMESYVDKLFKFSFYNFQKNYGYGRGGLAYSTYDFKAFVAELTEGNIPPAFEEQLERTIIYKDYVNTYTLPGLEKFDWDMYSGIGCYIPSVGSTNWNNYFKNLQWYSAVGWSETGW